LKPAVVAYRLRIHSGGNHDERAACSRHCGDHRFASAQAQDPDAQRLEEITVTARKVSENLQDTPIAITALTGSALEDRQIFSTNVLDQVVPNLQFGDNAALAGNNHLRRCSSAASARPIRLRPSTGRGPLHRRRVHGHGRGRHHDLARHRFHAGAARPQGTLFGRNTIGGAILIRRRIRATNSAARCAPASARTTCSMDSSRSTRLLRHVKARFAFGIAKQDGYVTRPTARISATPTRCRHHEVAVHAV
jgi:iron complex outermembrane receptor protein